MTAKPASDPNDWTSMWADAQQKYWQSWMDLSRQAGKPEPPPQSPAPWAQALDFWAKLVAGAAPAESRGWVEKLLDLNRGYLHMGETLWKNLSVPAGRHSGPEAWMEAVNQGIRQMQESFGASLGNAKDPWAAFATFWGMPLDNWRRVCSACSALPGDMEKALRDFGAWQPAAGPEDHLSRMLGLPALGYTREWQEEAQRWGQLWLEHQAALRDYGTEVLSPILTRAAELLSAKLSEAASQGKTPESLREFYNFWVDCGEQAYAQMAMTPEFSLAQARLLNTLMAVKRQEQKMVDESLSALNMPTRRELDTSHRRTHELRREIRRLQDALEGADIQALRDELAALRREVETLRAEGESARTARRNAKTNP